MRTSLFKAIVAIIKPFMTGNLPKLRILKLYCPVIWGCSTLTAPLQRSKIPQMGNLLAIMVKGGILVVEQSMTCNTPLWPILRLNEWLGINQLVISSPSTYTIVPTLLPLWQNLFIIYLLEGSGVSALGSTLNCI